VADFLLVLVVVWFWGGTLSIATGILFFPRIRIKARTIVFRPLILTVEFPVFGREVLSSSLGFPMTFFLF